MSRVEDLVDIMCDNDMLYIYVETWFSGFSPCFKDGMYSLACCMGNKKNGGMKASACKLSQKGNVWILSVAGKTINRTEKNEKMHNCSGIQYQPGDMIYLSKVDMCYTWPEYYNKYYKTDRRDIIYRFEGNKVICFKECDHTQENSMTDCALDHKDYRDIKQIITSKNYAVFNSGNKLPSSLKGARGGCYKGNDISILKEYLINNKECFNSEVLKLLDTIGDINYCSKGSCK